MFIRNWKIKGVESKIKQAIEQQQLQIIQNQNYQD
jgi:hypothetical protein